MPAVAPLDWETPAHGRENDLHAVVAEVLERITGTERPSEQQLSQYINEAYARHFGGAPPA
jgi:hypothetical protein